MNITIYDQARRFYRDTNNYLLSKEAENNLIIGLSRRLSQSVASMDDVLFASVKDDDRNVLAAFLRTPPRKLIVTGFDESIVLGFIRNMSNRAWMRDLPGVIGPEETAASFASNWSALYGKKAEINHSMSIYQLDELKDVPRAAGRLRPVKSSELRLVTNWALEFTAEAGMDETPRRTRQMVIGGVDQGNLYVWECGTEVVSMALIGRTTPNGSGISLVYTPPEFRQSGFATSCVGSLCQKILKGGKKFCTLYADQANSVSNSIYTKLGFCEVGKSVEYRFF